MVLLRWLPTSCAKQTSMRPSLCLPVTLSRCATRWQSVLVWRWSSFSSVLLLWVLSVLLLRVLASCQPAGLKNLAIIASGMIDLPESARCRPLAALFANDSARTKKLAIVAPWIAGAQKSARCQEEFPSLPVWPAPTNFRARSKAARVEMATTATMRKDSWKCVSEMNAPVASVGDVEYHWINHKKNIRFVRFYKTEHVNQIFEHWDTSCVKYIHTVRIQYRKYIFYLLHD